MKKISIILLFPFLLSAYNLKTLIELAEKQNDLIVSKKFIEQSKQKELDSKKSAYFPKLDSGAFYQKNTQANPLQPSDTYGAFAKVGYDIYDGGKRSYNTKSATSTLKSSKYATKALKKSLALQITQDFYRAKTLESSLEAREEAQKTLKAQLERVKSFYEAKMATKDDVDRIQADFDTNSYEMESIKFEILSLKSSLSLKTGTDVLKLDKSYFKKSLNQQLEKLDSTKSLLAQKASIEYKAQSVDSYYYPNIKIEDSYTFYGYSGENEFANSIGASPLDKQNSLLVSLNFRLFDYGELRKSKEAVLLNSQALNSQINFQIKEQDINYKLAKAKIKTEEIKIKSAKSALNAANSAFVTIEKKYDAGIVDYIVYLDALTKKTSALALYEESLNSLEFAYGAYYYYSGKDIKEELQ
jgi:outer membrane protein TolC